MYQEQNHQLEYCGASLHSLISPYLFTSFHNGPLILWSMVEREVLTAPEFYILTSTNHERDCVLSQSRLQNILKPLIISVWVRHDTHYWVNQCVQVVRIYTLIRRLFLGIRSGWLMFKSSVSILIFFLRILSITERGTLKSSTILADLGVWLFFVFWGFFWS